MTSPTPVTEWTELLVLLDRDGMSQAQLARLAGISASYLNDLIRGRRRITGKCRRAIAEVLQVPQSMLIPQQESA